MNIQENLNEVKRTLPKTVTLVAVSKTQPDEAIMEAYSAGQRIFGENKPQELASKYARLPKDIEWHMIGHLQTNKVKLIVPFVSLIHSIDSPRLLDEVERQAARINRTIRCLLQVHIADEETKYGFAPDELTAFLPSLEHYKKIEVVGLMGMATFTEDEVKVRSEFRKLKSLFDKVSALPLYSNTRMEHLSMGMSGDYPLAIEEGSTLVRVGTKIFGARH